MHRFLRLAAGIWLISVLLAGCASGSSLSYYLIDPAPGEVMLPAGDAVLVIEILDVQLPRYLDRNQIVKRRADGQLALSNSHHWGENLRLNLLRTLAQNLSERLDSVDVATPRARSATLPDFRIALIIEAFEPDPRGRVQLLARWQIMDRAGNVAATRRSRLEAAQTVRDGDFPGLVRAMSGLYGELSDEIARELLAVAGSRLDRA